MDNRNNKLNRLTASEAILTVGAASSIGLFIIIITQTVVTGAS